MIVIGKYKIGKDEEISSVYVHEGGLKLLSSRTYNNIVKLQNKIGFIPTQVYIGIRENVSRKSFYVLGTISGRDILFVRKETDSPMGGTTKLYSEVANKSFSKLIDLTNEEIYEKLFV
jgi:hypothetical protein